MISEYRSKVNQIHQSVNVELSHVCPEAGKNWVMSLKPLPTPLDRRDDVLSAIISRLVEAYEPERIYLFGSAAAALLYLYGLR